MSKRELAIPEQGRGGELADSAQIASMMEQMMGLMRGMAETMRTTNDRVAALEKQAALNTRVTAGQAKRINAMIREQAERVAAAHGMGSNASAAQAIARAIRRDVCLAAGVSSSRELPKCEYSVYLQQVELWDDFRIVKAVKARLREAEDAGRCSACRPGGAV